MTDQQAKPNSAFGTAHYAFVAALAVLTLAAYLPSLPGGMIFDDEILLGSAVRSRTGLSSIWCSTDFPLTQTMMWLEWRLWGDNLIGYRVVSVLLHIISAILLWRVLRRLAVPGAYIAALLFAIHPVCVESVAYVAEQRNALAMSFFLATILFYLKWRTATRARYYILSIICFVLALLSKTAVVPLPFVLLLCDWWQREPLTKLKRFLPVVPYLALSLIAGLHSISFQQHGVIVDEVVHSAGPAARLAGAGWAVWFYLWKALWPAHLSLIYPRWQIATGSVLSWVPLVTVVIATAVLWSRRNHALARAVLFALAYFLVMLGPIIGFVDIYTFKFSSVTDHWQYFGIIGVIALVAVAIAKLPIPASVPREVVALLVGLPLVYSTAKQAGLYGSTIAIWRDTIKENPTSVVAHDNLGVCLVNRAAAFGPRDQLSAKDKATFDQLIDEAMAQYRKALTIDPNDIEAHNNIGNACLLLGRADDAKSEYELTIKANPRSGLGYIQLGVLLEQRNDIGEAEKNYREAVRLWPYSSAAYQNLAIVLEKRNAASEAIEAYKRVTELVPDEAFAHIHLAKLLVDAHKTKDAIPHLKKALRIEPDNAFARGLMRSISDE